MGCGVGWNTDSLTVALGWAGCGSNCYVTVTYMYTRDCGTCEYILTKLEYHNVANCSCWYWEAFRKSIMFVLLNSPISYGCLPQPDQPCNTNSRMTMKGCWSQRSGPTQGNVTWEYCQGSVCCRAVYEICPSQSGSGWSIRTVSNSSHGTCHGDCVAMCESLDISWP